MMSNEFEKALDAFLEGAEADEAHQALYDIIRAAFQRQIHGGILRKTFRHDAGLSLAFKLVSHGTGRTDAASVFGEQGTQLGSGTVCVVRRHFNQESRA